MVLSLLSLLSSSCFYLTCLWSIGYQQTIAIYIFSLPKLSFLSIYSILQSSSLYLRVLGGFSPSSSPKVNDILLVFLAYGKPSSRLIIYSVFSNLVNPQKNQLCKTLHADRLFKIFLLRDFFYLHLLSQIFLTPGTLRSRLYWRRQYFWILWSLREPREI